MSRYLLGRVAQSALAVFGVMAIVFVVMRLSGDPTLLLVPEGATREQIDALRHQLGFDRPIPIQFADYLWTLTRLDLGESVVQRLPAIWTTSDFRKRLLPARTRHLCRPTWYPRIPRNALRSLMPNWRLPKNAVRPNSPRKRMTWRMV